MKQAPTRLGLGFKAESEVGDRAGDLRGGASYYSQ